MTSPESHSAGLIGRYHRIAKKVDSLQAWLLLLLRLYIGYQSMVAGWGHLHNIDKTAEFFTSLHIPMPRLNVYISALTELIGGALILVGLFSRLAAIPFTFNFLVAMLSVHLADPDGRSALKNIWQDQDVILKDTAFPFFFVGLLIFIFGPGWISLDRLLKKIFLGKD